MRSVSTHNVGRYTSHQAKDCLSPAWLLWKTAHIKVSFLFSCISVKYTYIIWWCLIVAILQFDLYEYVRCRFSFYLQDIAINHLNFKSYDISMYIKKKRKAVCKKSWYKRILEILFVVEINKPKKLKRNCVRLS